MKHRRKVLAGFALAILIAGAAIYYTGDQKNSVGVSATFTIDTRVADEVARPHILLIAESNLFTIDTRDPENVARPYFQLTNISGLFTIDTRDPDISSRPSIAQYGISQLFLIDTTADGSSYLSSGLFTIDTRDPDSVSRSISFLTALSDLFIIDTTDPTPLDTDGDGLPDAWEKYYFGHIHGANPHEDTDGDGLSNRLEFLFGTNPLVADNFGIINTEFSADGDGHFIISIRLNPEALGSFHVEPQFSRDLSQWKEGLLYVKPHGIPTQHEDGTETHYFRAVGPISQSAFMRIVITDELLR